MNATTLRRVGSAWLVIGLILLVWTVAVAAANSSVRDRHHKQQRSFAAREHFYRVIAGIAVDDQGGVLNKLGRDLRSLKTAKDVRDFRGTSNKYGGITLELGFDPFDGVYCSECGPLDPDVQDDVVLVKQGGLANVLSHRQVPSAKLHHGPGWAAWIAWLLTFPLMYGASWFAGSLSRSHRYGNMQEEMRLIGKLDKALEGSFDNPQDRIELEHTRERLMQEIDTRVSYGQRAKQRMRLADLKDEAQRSLESIEQGNKALQ